MMELLLIIPYLVIGMIVGRVYVSLVPVVKNDMDFFIGFSIFLWPLFLIGACALYATNALSFIANPLIKFVKTFPTELKEKEE